jgi:hypothetical protein
MAAASFKLGLMGAALAAAVSISGAARAQQAFYVGPEACAQCHKPESEVWQKTKHATSFNEFHRGAKTRDVLKVTGERSPKTSQVCVTCHYTTAQKDAAAKPDQVAGPSCESCHGPASNWIKVHNDFGGPGVKKEQESADHKTKRLADAMKAGMVPPEDKFDVVSNCYGCHGLGKAKVDGKVLGQMIDAGHPTNDDFEFIKFYSGQVKHRFYPPDTTKNQDMMPQLKAEWFAVGQAAALVAATAGAGKTDNAKYTAAEKARIDQAKQVLSKIPEASKVVAQPTVENGRAFAAAVKGKDLTKAVTPPEGGYK